MRDLRRGAAERPPPAPIRPAPPASRSIQRTERGIECKIQCSRSRLWTALGWDVCIFALSKQCSLIAEHNLGEAVFAPPIFANGVLYLTARSRLHALCRSAPMR
jgi:hypothetical protein